MMKMKVWEIPFLSLAEAVEKLCCMNLVIAWAPFLRTNSSHGLCYGYSKCDKTLERGNPWVPMSATRRTGTRHILAPMLQECSIMRTDKPSHRLRRFRREAVVILLTTVVTIGALVAFGQSSPTWRHHLTGC